MSPTPEPPTGIYRDSSGTRYLATQERRTGLWRLQKQTGEKGRPPAAFDCQDFIARVNAGIFIFSTDPA